MGSHVGYTSIAAYAAASLLPLTVHHHSTVRHERQVVGWAKRQLVEDHLQPQQSHTLIDENADLLQGGVPCQRSSASCRCHAGGSFALWTQSQGVQTCFCLTGNR
jgi:hypothetical protein